MLPEFQQGFIVDHSRILNAVESPPERACVADLDFHNDAFSAKPASAPRTPRQHVPSMQRNPGGLDKFEFIPLTPREPDTDTARNPRLLGKASDDLTGVAKLWMVPGVERDTVTCTPRHAQLPRKYTVASSSIFGGRLLPDSNRITAGNLGNLTPRQTRLVAREGREESSLVHAQLKIEISSGDLQHGPMTGNRELADVLDWIAHGEHFWPAKEGTATKGSVSKDSPISSPEISAIQITTPRWVELASSASVNTEVASFLSICHSSEHFKRSLVQQQVLSDEEEWKRRQTTTGSVCRLVIYSEGENPCNDVVLRGGAGHPITVACAVEEGIAHKAGVRAGDRLVSINGKKDFVDLSLDELKTSSWMCSPAMLVFLGFVGKLHAEVRLPAERPPCGIPINRDVWPSQTFEDKETPSVPFRVCEEKIFNTGRASLFLAVSNIHDASANDDDDSPQNNEPTPFFEDIDDDYSPQDNEPTPFFEVRRTDARAWVRSALLNHRAKNKYCKDPRPATPLDVASGSRDGTDVL